MPDNFSALIPAATIAQEDTIRQLLVYLQRIFLYAPAEGEPLGLPAEFSDLCQRYAPVPFAEALGNFHTLIRDMTRHRAEYYGGGLSSLSAKTAAVDQESVWGLVKRLHPKTAAGHGADEPLLQARLLLKLAEVHEQEEREIAQALNGLAGKGLTMLQGLTSEDDDAEDLAAELAALAHIHGHPGPDTLPLRLRAWARLFVHDPRQAEHWLLATTAEVFSLLTDYASVSLSDLPRPLLSLPLPGPALLELPPKAYLETRQAWQAANATPLSQLHAGLRALAYGGPAQVDGLEATFRPPLWHEGTSGTLDCYLLPLSLPQLMRRLVGDTPPTNVDRHQAPHGVVAVVSASP